MLGAPRPFWVEPFGEGGDDDVGGVPVVAPGAAPKLELPRGSSGSSSLQPKVARKAVANRTLGEEARIHPP
jgi:hypothetical protein